MAAGPVAVRHRADPQREVDAVAGVVAGAAHLGQIPVGAEILGPPQHIGMEATGSENHSLGEIRHRLAVLHGGDAPLVADALQPGSLRSVADLYALLFRPAIQRLHQTETSA